MSAYKNLSIIWNKLCRKQEDGSWGYQKRNNEDQRLQFPPDLSRLLSKGTIFPWCLHIEMNPTWILKSQMLAIFIDYLLFSLSLLSARSHTGGGKSGENKQKISNSQRLWKREIWRDPSHCPHSYHFLLNESVLFPGSLTSCSCYWLTKEVSNYKKTAFCSFQGLGGFCVLDIRQRKCNLCKLQITRYKSGDEI